MAASSQTASVVPAVCSACLQPLMAGDCQVLMCSHTLCESCLQDVEESTTGTVAQDNQEAENGDIYQDKTFICPLCSKNIKTPSRDDTHAQNTVCEEQELSTTKSAHYLSESVDVIFIHDEDENQISTSPALDVRLNNQEDKNDTSQPPTLNVHVNNQEDKNSTSQPPILDVRISNQEDKNDISHPVHVNNQKDKNDTSHPVHVNNQEDKNDTSKSPTLDVHVNNQEDKNDTFKPPTLHVPVNNHEDKNDTSQSPPFNASVNSQKGKNETSQPPTLDVRVGNQEDENDTSQPPILDVCENNQEDGNQISQPLSAEVSDNDQQDLDQGSQTFTVNVCSNDSEDENQASGPLICAVCDDDEEATHRCEDCAKNMCPQCQRFHGKFHSDHQTRVLVETSQSDPQPVDRDLEERVMAQVNVVEAALLQMADDKRRLVRERQEVADVISRRADAARALVTQVEKKSQRALQDVARAKDVEVGEEMTSTRTKHSQLWQLATWTRDTRQTAGGQGRRGQMNIRPKDVSRTLLNEDEIDCYQKRAHGQQQVLSHHMDDALSSLQGALHTYLGISPSTSQAAGGVEDGSSSFLITSDDQEAECPGSVMASDATQVLADMAHVKHRLASLHDHHLRLQQLVDSLYGDVTNVKGDNSKLQMNIQTVRDDYCKPLQDIVALHREYNAFQHQFVALKDENSILQRDLAALRADIIKLQHDSVVLKGENNKFQQDLLDVKGNNDKLQQSVTVLKGEKDRLQQDVVVILQKKNELEQAVTMLNKENSSLAQEIAGVQGSLSEAEHNVKTLQDQGNTFQQDITTLGGNNSKLEQDVLTIREESYLLQQDVLIMKGEHHETHDHVTKTQKETGELQKDITRLKGHDDKCQQDIMVMKGDTAQLHADVLLLREEKEKMQQNILLLMGDSSKLQANIQDCVEKLARCNTLVAFHARLGSDRMGKYRGVLPLDEVRANAGQAYDPVTGVFTAPIAGTYLFLATICRDVGTGDAVLSLEVDGTLLTVSRSHVGQLEEGVSCTSHAAMRLDAGQKVWLRVWSDTGLLKYRTTFTGALVQGEL